jgi:hypothetical protein
VSAAAGQHRWPANIPQIIWRQTSATNIGGEHRLAEIILAKFRQYAYNLNRTKAAIGSLKAHFRGGLPADRRLRKFRWIEPFDATCVQRYNRGSLGRAQTHMRAAGLLADGAYWIAGGADRTGLLPQKIVSRDVTGSCPAKGERKCRL